MSAGLAFNSVTAVRGGRVLFEALGFALGPGDAALVTGPNGAGKSSLVRIAAGLLAPAAGTVTCQGGVALLTEAHALDPELPLARALAFWAALDDRRETVTPALAALGLGELADVPVRMLSTGQRRRAALARVVATAAPVWLLDEPANGLDDAAIATLEALIADHRAGGGCALVATHLPIRLPGAMNRVGHRNMTALGAIVGRDLRRAWAGGGAVLPVAFFLLATILFPFAVGPDAALLGRIGGGVIWAAALLAALMPVERLIAPDLEAGVFDQFAARGASMALVAAAKTLAHWLAFAPPLMLAAILAAGLLDLPSATLWQVEIGLAIGTPGLAALAVATSALVAGLRGASALAGLVMLPLAVPLLIFATGALAGGAGAIKLLGAVSLILVAGAPFVAAAAIRAGSS